MRGKIIRGVGGFYYVHCEDGMVYECRARGIFRKNGQKPLVGDDVIISLTCVEDSEGSLDEILPRRNELVRPAAANVDQVLVFFAAASPDPNFNLLDRYLVSMRRCNIPVILCFNKSDLVEQDVLEGYLEEYRGSGCILHTVSVRDRKGTDELADMLRGKTTCVAGPSGAGKSSLTNLLAPDAEMEVGEISRKIARGRQTTRHTQLICVAEGTYFLDTPGFGSMDLPQMDWRELKDEYPEFEKSARKCRFLGCVHDTEPDCGVKRAVRHGKISRLRYENYLVLMQELKNRKKY